MLIEKKLIDCENPRVKGKSLSVNHSSRWRYRIEDYRLTCHIEDEELIIPAFSI